MVVRSSITRVAGRWKKAGICLVFIFALCTGVLLPHMQAAALTPELPRVTFMAGADPASQSSVSALALVDVNGDGRKDFVLCGPMEDPLSGVDSAYVVFNTPTMPAVVDLFDLGTLGYEITSSEPLHPQTHQLNIRTVAPAGDLNGDGKEDILLYAINWYAQPAQHAYLIWGKSNTATQDLHTITAADGVRFDATNPTNPVYLAPRVVGDLNGDGHTELAFGDFAWAANQSGENLRGKVRVVFGRATWPASMDLDNLGSDGFQVLGKNHSQAGWSVSGVGDVNNDGLADMAFTAPDDVVNLSNGSTVEGAVYVIFGSNSLGADMSVQTLGSQGYRLYAPQYSIQPGEFGIAPLGDVNGDSLDDFAIKGDPPAPVWIAYGQTSTTSVPLATQASHITSSSTPYFTAAIASDASHLHASDHQAAGPDGQQYAGRIWALDRQTLDVSRDVASAPVDYSLRGAAPNMYLGGIIASGSANGELLVSVSSGTSAYVAAVVPERDAVITLPGFVGDSPTVEASVTPAPNQAGWHNSNVSVSWTVTDATTTNGCGATTVSTDTGPSGIELTCAATNAFGTTTKSVTVKLDTDNPTLNAPLVPAPNAAGWNNNTVTVNFSCEDESSGVATCPAPVSVTTETPVAGQQVWGTATDNAGNITEAGRTVKLDKTRPTVSSLTVTPGLIFLAGNLNIRAAATDALSGIAGGEYFIDVDPGAGNGIPMSYSAANGTVSATKNIGFNSISRGFHTLTVRTQDVAGNWSLVASRQFLYF
jgi:hypothetical protein